MDIYEVEYTLWLTRGHSRSVAAYAVYMAHCELAPEWLAAHR